VDLGRPRIKTYFLDESKQILLLYIKLEKQKEREINININIHEVILR
jgi:hypothetical protein